MSADRLRAFYDRASEASNAITQLRRFILDLAVRGRLVEQEATARSVAELQKKTQKDEDSRGVGPSSWFQTSVGEILKFQYGKGLNASKRKKAGPVPVYGSNGVVGYTEEPLTVRPCVVVGRKGSAGALNSCNGPSWTTDVAYFVEVPSSFDINFLYLSLSALDLSSLAKGVKPGLSRADVYRRVIGVPPLGEQRRIVAKVDELMALCDQFEASRNHREVTRDRLIKASLARLTAPDTDNETFRSHAHFAVDVLSVTIARTEEVKQLRQTILDLAVRGKLVEQDQTDVSALDHLRELTDIPRATKRVLESTESRNGKGDLPASWSWRPLGALIRTMDAGWSPQCENSPRHDERQWCILKTTAVQPLAFDPAQNKKLPDALNPRPEFEIRTGDILVTRAGPKQRVGVSCVVDAASPGVMISDKLIRVRVLGDLVPKYVALALNSGLSFEQIEDAKSGMAVMQMNISQAKLCAIELPLPPLGEQHRIVAKVDELMTLCSRLESELTTADTARRKLLESLLYEALALGEGAGEKLSALREDSTEEVAFRGTASGE